MTTTPRGILILHQASSATRRGETLAKKMAVTWWQDFRERERVCANVTVTWWQEFRERVSAAVTWWQELQNRLAITTTWQESTKKSPTAPAVHLQESRKRTSSQVNRNSAVRIPLQRSKQTNFCWPFSSWQVTTILQIFTITSTEFPNCQNRSRQRCLRSTGNLKSLSCLKIYSKRASKFIISWLKMTESITSILSWGGMRYKLKSNNGPTQENLGEILAVFRRKYVKPQSMATAKHKLQKLVINPANQKSVDFLDELQELAKDAFGTAAHAIIEQFKYAKMPPDLKNINKSGKSGEWHIWTECYIPREGIRVEWFGSPRWTTDKYCEPQYCKHNFWQTQTNVPPL